MITIKTDNVMVEIDLDSHFYLKRGAGDDDSLRVEWKDLDAEAAAGLRQFAELVEGTLEGMNLPAKQ